MSTHTLIGILLLVAYGGVAFMIGVVIADREAERRIRTIRESDEKLREEDEKLREGVASWLRRPVFPGSPGRVFRCYGICQVPVKLDAWISEDGTMAAVGDPCRPTQVLGPGKWRRAPEDAVPADEPFQFMSL